MRVALMSIAGQQQTGRGQFQFSEHHTWPFHSDPPQVGLWLWRVPLIRTGETSLSAQIARPHPGTRKNAQLSCDMLWLANARKRGRRNCENEVELKHK